MVTDIWALIKVETQPCDGSLGSNPGGNGRISAVGWCFPPKWPVGSLGRWARRKAAIGGGTYIPRCSWQNQTTLSLQHLLSFLPAQEGTALRRSLLQFSGLGAFCPQMLTCNHFGPFLSKHCTGRGRSSAPFSRSKLDLQSQCPPRGISAALVPGSSSHNNAPAHTAPQLQVGSPRGEKHPGPGKALPAMRPLRLCDRDPDGLALV